MPNMRSAAKRMKSDARKGERNQTVLSELHNRFKKLVPLVGENKELAKKQALVLISKLDKAASQGIIPSGRADRKKARIAKLLNKQVPLPKVPGS